MASASFGDNTQAYTYDNRLQTVTNTIKNSFQATLYSESNTFNSAGNMTESVTAFYDTQSRTKTLAHSYGYDIFGQLTGEQYKQSGVTLYANAFDYDFSGNLTELNNETFGVNEKNQLEATLDSAESTTLAYDNNGNLLSRTYWDGGAVHTETYEYDVWGQMVESDVNGMVTTYTYYPDGLRKTKTVGEETTRYYYDGDVVVNEAVNGQWSASNVKALGNRIVKRTTEDGENALMYNSRGDVVMILAWENSAEPVAAYLYLAYGKLYSDLSDFYGTSTLYDPYVFDCPILYAGQYYDNETGLYYLRARYYSPDLCRFISEDTHWHIGNMIYGDGDSKTPSHAAILQSNNLYAYCMGNPVMFIDVTGNIGTPLSWAMTIIFGIAGGLYGNYLADQYGYTGWKKAALISAVAVGGALIGFMAGEIIVGFTKAFLTANPAILIKISPTILKILGITGSNLAVLGSTDYGVGYVNMAQHLGASFFRIADAVWNSMTDGQRWEANMAFLDDMIKQGKEFLLTNNAWETIKNFPDSNLGKEIAYLLKQGYKIVDDGYRMIKG